MGVSRATSDDPGDKPARIGLADAGAAGQDGSDAPTRQFVGGTVGDSCANCGAPMASDQHYCINCGERRGKARFGLGANAAPPAAASPPPRHNRRPRLSSSAALVAGVGVLLLAMGVGVLIGKTNANSSQRASAGTPPVQVVTVAGSGGSAAAPTAAAATATAARGKAKATKIKRVVRHQAAQPAVSHKQAAKAQAAASKVLGTSNSKNLPPPTVTVGQKGHGPGFDKKTGHFTGTFFGQ